MFDLIVLVAGALLVALVFFDAFATTLAVGAGAGPLTRRLVGPAWRALLRLHRTDSHSALLRVAGPVLLITTVLVWVALLWAGWSLVLLAGDGSVVDATTRAPAGTADVIYYAGFTVFTLGVGDFVATTSTWRVVTSGASFSGLFLITLAITYLISVVSAVVARRAVAIRINALGGSASEIVGRGWAGDSFSSAFVQQLVALSGELATTAEQHLAYPVLHYFHSGGRGTSAPVAVAHLDDAMMLLQRAVAPEAQPDISAVDPVRQVVSRYLSTSSMGSGTPDPDAPPVPPLGSLEQAGVPVVAPDVFAARLREEERRRRRLHRLVLSDGWSWSERSSDSG